MSDKKPKHPGGRPHTYTPEMAKKICRGIATSSKGIRRLCKENPDWPSHQAIFEWRLDIPEFGELYAQAKRDQIEFLIDECIDISDDSNDDEIIDTNGNVKANAEFIQRSRLRVDTRKWLAAKLAPKLYGDRTHTTQDITVRQEDALKELA